MKKILFIIFFLGFLGAGVNLSYAQNISIYKNGSRLYKIDGNSVDKNGSRLYKFDDNSVDKDGSRLYKFDDNSVDKDGSRLYKFDYNIEEAFKQGSNIQKFQIVMMINAMLAGDSSEPYKFDDNSVDKNGSRLYKFDDNSVDKGSNIRYKFEGYNIEEAFRNGSTTQKLQIVMMLNAMLID